MEKAIDWAIRKASPAVNDVLRTVENLLELNWTADLMEKGVKQWRSYWAQFSPVDAIMLCQTHALRLQKFLDDGWFEPQTDLRAPERELAAVDVMTWWPDLATDLQEQVNRDGQNWSASNVWTFLKNLLFMTVLPPVYWIAVRPGDAGYDALYYKENYDQSVNRFLDAKKFTTCVLRIEREYAVDSSLVSISDDNVNVAVEVNDVAYYIPYFKFPNSALVAITYWEYFHLPGKHAAPYGEGDVLVTGKPLSYFQSHTQKSNGPTGYQNEQHLEIQAVKLGLAQCGYHNSTPTGSTKTYQGFNVWMDGADKYLHFGIHRLCGWIGVGSEAIIRVKPVLITSFVPDFRILIKGELAKRALSLARPIVDLVDRAKPEYAKLESIVDQLRDRILDVYHVRNIDAVTNLLMMIMPCAFSKEFTLRKSSFFLKEVKVTLANWEPRRRPEQWGRRFCEWIGEFFDGLESSDGYAKHLVPADYVLARVGDESLLLSRFHELLHRAIENVNHVRPDWKQFDSDAKEFLGVNPPARTRAVLPLVNTRTEISEFYYYVKIMDPEAIIPLQARALHPELNSGWADKRNALVRWYRRRQQIEDLSRPRAKKMVKTGFDLRIGGEDIVSYEFDSKSELNKLFAAFARQLASKNSPNLTHLALYERMMREFWWWFEEELAQFEPDSVPYRPVDEWINGHTDWTQAKKLKYAKTISMQLTKPTRAAFSGAFELMVKGGEGFSTKASNFVNATVENVSERPRAISNPSDQLCGLLTYLQSAVVFPILKRIVPGFVHALNCHDLVDKINEDTAHMPLQNCKSVSFDGSGFDANQHIEIQDLVDEPLYMSFEPFFRAYLLKHKLTKHVDEVLEGLKKGWVQGASHWFLNLPGISDFIDNRKDAKSYQKYFRRQCPDVFQLTLTGTTFSGHPTKTTLGNTLRSLSYMWYTAWTLGIEQPWLRNQWIHCMAAGDDSVMFVEHTIVDRLVQRLREHFAPAKSIPNYGLGQCIDGHGIHVRPVRDFDFCSKWCFYQEGTWFVTRDYSKFLWSKQCYYGDCEEFFGDPTLHAAAIDGALEAEGLKHGLLRTLSLHRTNGANQKACANAYEKWLVGNSWARHYQSEALPHWVVEEIDRKCDLTIFNVLRACAGNVLDL